MDTILKISNLTKNYYNTQALKGIDLEVERGKILGLLGPNGSGKTTLMKIIAGILKPTSGEVLIEGKKPGIYTKQIVSYLPDVNPLYKWMRVKDAVNFFKDFYNDFDEEKAKSNLDFMELKENQKVSSLSKGMLERLLLALFLSRNAKLYILDEPLGGVDPSARDKIIDTIIKNINEDSSMVISTHIIRDIEKVFDEVAFFSEGTIILKEETEDLRRKKGKSIDEIFREIYANV